MWLFLSAFGTTTSILLVTENDLDHGPESAWRPVCWQVDSSNMFSKKIIASGEVYALFHHGKTISWDTNECPITWEKILTQWNTRYDEHEIRGSKIEISTPLQSLMFMQKLYSYFTLLWICPFLDNDTTPTPNGPSLKSLKKEFHKQENFTEDCLCKQMWRWCIR